MHHFFLPAHLLTANPLILPDTIAHQVRDVLRMRGGDEIILLDNAGWQYRCTLGEISRRLVSVHVLDKTSAPPEPRTQITLYQGLPKKDKFEWILQKCTELGVARFVPVFTQRTVPDQMTPTKRTRLERIITEAAEQSRRGRLPELRDPMPFEQAIAESGQFSVALIPYEAEQQARLGDKLPTEADSIALFIGPEGGFSVQEIEAAKTAGVQPISLGPRILRTETAAIATVALIMGLLGEI